MRPLSQKRGNLVVFGAQTCDAGVAFSFCYANGRKVDKYDINKECKRLALKHGGDPEKSHVLKAVFVRQRFGHQHFGSTRKGTTRRSAPAQVLMVVG